MILHHDQNRCSPDGIRVHAARIILNVLIFFSCYISPFHSEERDMPNKRIAMRKISEILRLRFEVGLSFRQISQCADVSTGAIQKMLNALTPPGSPGRCLRG